MKSLTKLFRLLIKDNLKEVILSFLISVFTIICSVCLMGLSSYIISFCALRPSIADIAVAVVGVRFFGIGRGVSRYGERLITHNTTFSLLSRLRVWLFRRIEYLPTMKFMNMDKGEVFTRLVDDIETLQEFFLRTFMPFIIAVLVGIVGVIGLSFFRNNIAITFASIYLITILLMPALIWNFSKGLYKKLIREKAGIKTSAIDFFSSLDELIGNSAIKKYRDRLGERMESYDEISRKLVLWRSVSSSMIMLFTKLAMFGCLIGGIVLVHSGKLNGVYLAVVALTASALFEGTMGIPIMIQKLEQSAEAADRIYEIETLANSEGIGRKTILRGDEVNSINMKNIEFSYDNRKILKDINISMERGKHIALLGASGSGKTTISYLLMNWLKPDSGIFEVEGNIIERENVFDFSELFSIVNQDVYFFNTTLLNNIKLGNKNSSQREVESALNKAQISEFVNGLEGGLETELGENGMKLSGGQRQRIALARALLKNSPFMIFDEPTSGLDVFTEKMVFEAIHSSTEDRGILVITHRLVSMDKYDEILVLVEGRIVERGTHLELMAKGGIYEQMWNLQRGILSL